MRRNSSNELSNTPATVNVMTFPISNTSLHESMHAAAYPKIHTNRVSDALRANTAGFVNDSVQRQLQSHRDVCAAGSKPIHGESVIDVL